MQARDIHGGVHLHAREDERRQGSAVRSAYLEQVGRLAPESLYDRDEELTELATWCASDDHDASYTWWQASAWAGKSALMSWFVLHPPPDARIVSFFVTSRLSGQNNKTAFAEVVLEQLAELLGQSLPELLTDATRDAHLLRLLAQAATTCQERGERLILVVDGLDEDRGVTVGPEGHSIAALHPSRPPGGLRIVIAGRPDPPIPTDVPQVVRRLQRSEHAEVVRVDAQRELGHLLRGTPAERDLLGLVAAAGGGLSSRDLTELTGWPEWEVEEHLRAVSGRTFSHRAAHWRPDSTPSVYLLAHEQLQQDAIRMMGEARMADLRQRLHLWADRHRERGRPIGTPEYLLRGYFGLLRELNETSRLVGCALDRDRARHERMLDLTGGDSAALTEIVAAQDVVSAQEEPDLLAMIRLVIYRAELNDRNFLIPPELPEVWAHLGHHARAEALAGSLPDPVQRMRALNSVASISGVQGSAPLAHAASQPPIGEGAAPGVAEPGNQEMDRIHALGVERSSDTDNLRRRKQQHKATPESVADAIESNKLSLAETLALRLRRGAQRWKAIRQVVRAMLPEPRPSRQRSPTTTCKRRRCPRWSRR
ncbi:hypothetical protein [Umezawaea sp. NPDC059074]|uniref:hypothetical protein n=1 Tax=Umezawaea sp. NPDC059074 TaxID=3346716 RepID=UPI0036B723E2